MKSSLKVFVAFAIISNALCLDLGRLLGLRRDWRDLSNEPPVPEIIEVVRWRQPVCVVPGPGVPPCIVVLKKNQEEYERNSAKGIESNQSEKPKSLIAKEQKKIRKEFQSAFPGSGRDIEEDIADFCRQQQWLARSGSKRQDDYYSEDYDICEDFDWYKRSERTQDAELEKPNRKILTPQIVDSVSVESVDVVELEGSEVSGRSNLDHSVTLNLGSKTPGMEEARVHRQGKYLLIGGSGKSAQPVQSPPAIFVTKVLNSPVTATLVANNCFPDIGVPLCDEYQETLTIYQETVAPAPVHHDTMDNVVPGFPDAAFLQDNTEQAVEPLGEEPAEEFVQENTESSDFWSDPNNPHFDDGTSSNEPQRPAGLLEQAVNHVLSKPGVISAIPPGVIDAIANNPAVLEALANAGSSGESTNGDTQINVTAVKPQIVTNSEITETVIPATTSKPGFISSLLDIQRPAILNNFWHPGFGLFNKNKTARPEKISPVNGTVGSQSSGHFGSGLIGQGVGQGPVVDAIHNLIHKPTTVNTNEKPEFQPVLVVEPPQRPGIFENLWNPTGGFGLFDRHSTTTGKPVDVSTEEPNVFISEIEGAEEPQPKPTQAPGIFGGLFSNPSRPTAAGTGGDSTHGILGIGSSIFPQPTNRPLIIARPGAKPLLVEKPIYLQEKPPQTSGLLNFFMPANNKPLLNVDHEVIKDPVYVYQKPQSAAGFLSNVFGSGVAPSRPTFFQGWAIFGNHQETSANKTEATSQENQNKKSASEQTATDSAKISAEEIEEINEESKTTVDEIPEAIPVVQTPLKTATPVENTEEEIPSDSNIKSTSSAVEFIPEENEEKIVNENSASTDIPDFSSVEDEIKAAEVAVGPETILEDSDKNATKMADDLAEEGEILGEESVIDNEA